MSRKQGRLVDSRPLLSNSITICEHAFAASGDERLARAILTCSGEIGYNGSVRH